MIFAGWRVFGRGARALAGCAVALAMAAGGAHAQGEPAADADAGEEAEAPPPVIVSEAEAAACAARLEPMVAIADEADGGLYLRRRGETVFEVWAPRTTGPQAPLEPWCVTSLEAIAAVPFTDTHTRAVVMELVAAAGLDPPPAPDGVPPVATGTPPEVIVEGEEEDDGTQGLPAAFQRLPPKGGRSAPTLGLPVPLTPALSGAGRADVLACRDGGGQPTAVVDRFTGRRLDVACWMPDGTDSPLPSLAADLEALTP